MSARPTLEREQGMVNFPGLNNAPARSQLPRMLGEPLGSTETGTLGSGRTLCSLLGPASSRPMVPTVGRELCEVDPGASPIHPRPLGWGDSDPSNLPWATVNINQGPAWHSGNKEA